LVQETKKVSPLELIWEQIGAHSSIKHASSETGDRSIWLFKFKFINDLLVLQLKKKNFAKKKWKKIS
jgi:hypothetical protein